MSGWWVSLNDEGRAAWVQAIGSLLAIFLTIAIFVIQRQIENRREKTRARQSRLTGLLVMSLKLGAVRREIEAIHDALQQIGSRRELQDEELSTFAVPALVQVLDASERLAELPSDALDRLLRLIEQITTFQRLLSLSIILKRRTRFQELHTGQPPGDRYMFAQPVDATVERLKSEVLAMLAAIEEMILRLDLLMPPASKI